MELADLGTPAQLWRRWVLVAAAYAGQQREGCEIRRSDGCGHLETDGGWLRVRRLGGNRAVVWGHHDRLASGPGFGEEVLDSAPDWAYDTDSRHAGRDVGFLAWHAHGRWSSIPARLPGEVGELLGPVADDDGVLTAWRAEWPATTADDLAAIATVAGEDDRTRLSALTGQAAAARAARQLGLGATWSARQISPTATVHLRSQVHAQMRTVDELADRGLPSRPPLLRQWDRVHTPHLPFRYAVCALAQGAVPSFVVGADAQGLTSDQLRTLENVLMELRMAETDETSGAWLFARVSGGHGPARVDRAFDHWPSWYRTARAEAGPTMTALHAEMVQRTSAWRPSWATLLPAERF